MATAISGFEFPEQFSLGNIHYLPHFTVSGASTSAWNMGFTMNARAPLDLDQCQGPDLVGYAGLGANPYDDTVLVSLYGALCRVAERSHGSPSLPTREFTVRDVLCI